MSIPFVGVLTLIRKDLLLRLIQSIDYPVDQFVILFQGGVADFDLSCIKNTHVKEFVFVSSDMNIGVSRGWNYLIRNFPSNYWIISGDDNYFESGTLERISQFMDKEDSLQNVFCGINMRQRLEEDTSTENHSYKVIPAGFSTFIVTSKIFENVGLFDENIYPAYFEDSDLWQRITLSGERTHTIENTFIYAGDNKDTGSCTIRNVSAEYRRKMDTCYCRNEKYFHDKWNTNETVSFTQPFGNNNYSIYAAIPHENYYKNQEILLGHQREPNISII